MFEARALRVVRGDAPALDAVDLTLSPGQMLAVVGPNGAGKTTLLRCLAGVLAPTSGQTLLEGRPLATWPRRERWRVSTTTSRRTCRGSMSFSDLKLKRYMALWMK